MFTPNLGIEGGWVDLGKAKDGAPSGPASTVPTRHQALGRPLGFESGFAAAASLLSLGVAGDVRAPHRPAPARATATAA